MSSDQIAKRRFPGVRVALAALAIVAGASTVPAAASSVAWSAFDQDDILDGGQTIANFAGIGGLTAVITASSNLNADLVHSANGNLNLNNKIGSSSAPVSMTFSFNQFVSFTSQIAYFGDGNVQEEYRWSSSTGTFDATPTGTGTVFDDLTSLVRITSGTSSSPFSIASAAIKDITIGLAGLNFAGLAGSTVSMDVELAPVTPVPLPAALPFFAVALGALGVTGLRRRRNKSGTA